MRERQSPTAVLVERTYTDLDHWRASTYRRPDGSIFRVAIPPYHLIDRFDGNPAGIVYDEAAEADMVLRLAPREEGTQ